MQKKYDTYKDSGIEWIGEIPSHWEIKKLKHYFSMGKGLAITKDNLQEAGVPVVSYGQIHSKSNTGVHLDNSLVRYVSEKYLENYAQALVPKGSFIFADTSEDLEGCGNCVYQDSDDKVFAGYHTIILFSQKMNEENKYLAYLFQDNLWRSQIRSRVYGVKVMSITRAILDECTISFPPLAEQRAIASYLDEKCGKVDELIADLEQQEKDLAAMKKSEISRVVTKGLNPNAPLKDSGVEWIGKVPEHWDVVPLKRALVEKMMYGANESAESNDRNYPRYIRITDIDENGYLKEDTFKSLPPDKAKDYMLKKGDILFARSGATVGKTFLYNSDEPACFAGYLIKAECNTELLSPEFLMLYTKSNEYDNWKNSVFAQATIQNIGADKYCTLPIVLPPFNEQSQITDYLNSYCQKIDKTIFEIKEQIADLKLYKQSLISEAVTGKVKVTD